MKKIIVLIPLLFVGCVSIKQAKKDCAEQNAAYIERLKKFNQINPDGSLR